MDRQPSVSEPCPGLRGSRLLAFYFNTRTSPRNARRREQPEEPILTFGDLIPPLPPTSQRSSTRRRLTQKRCAVVSASSAAIFGMVLVTALITIVTVNKKTAAINVEEEVGRIADHHHRHKVAYSCSSNQCNREAERIMQSVNKSTVGPCEDFYSYVCHGWLQENPILAGASKTSYNLELKERIEASLSAFIEAGPSGPIQKETTRNMSAINKFVSFVRGCEQKENIDNVGMKPLKRVLADLGLRDWPTVRATEPMVEVVAGRVTRDLGESTLFAISVGWDLVNKSGNIFTVDQPELSIRRGHLLGNARNLEAYRNVIKSAMALTKPEENLEGLAGEVMNLVHRISRSTKTPKERLKIGTHFLRERLDSLQAKTRWNWSNFLNTILEGVTTVPTKSLIRMRSPFYIGHMSRILNTVASSTVFNLVGFQVALTLSPLLAERARSVARLRLRRRFESNGESTSRQKMCLHLAQDAMPLVALHTYKVVFSKLYSPSIEKVLYTVESIRYFMKTFVDQARWMEYSTKMVAKHKLKTMKVHIFHPHWINEEERLGQLYSQTTVNRKEIAESYYVLRRASMRYYWSKYGKGPIDQEWQGSVFDTECTYDCETNSLFVPMGLFSEPVLHSDISAIIGVARPGSRIAHAMLAAIDRRGSHFTVSNTYRKWWTEETLYRYAQVQSCFMEQYKTIVDRKLHLRLTTSGNTDVNIADNAAAEVLFEAFLQTAKDMDLDERPFVISGLENFNLEQLFFVSYGLGFCEEQTDDFLKKQILHGTTIPAKYRINVPMGNMAAFASAFNCPSGSPMNRTLKCSLW